MKIFYSVILTFILSAFIYNLLTKKYVNPYKLIMYIGKKGSGKSTTISKLVRKYNKKGRLCYSTMKVSGAYYIDYKLIGYCVFPPNSVIFIDEVGMIYDNRDFKNFKPEVRNYFKLQRHYKNTVYLFSQSFDVDKKLRDLADEIWIISNKLRVFSYGKRVLKTITIVEASSQGESRVTENYKWDSFLFFFMGSRQFTFIPRYVDGFDSFETEIDVPVSGTYIDYPEKKSKMRFLAYSVYQSIIYFVRKLTRKFINVLFRFK